MMYIILDDTKIVNTVESNSFTGGVEISKKEYDKVTQEAGKIYKYVSKKVIAENDPLYLDKLKEEKTRDAVERANADSVSFFKYDSKDGYNKVPAKGIEKELSDKVNAINKCKTIEELNGVVI